jgi:hypothetical protein
MGRDANRCARRRGVPDTVSFDLDAGGYAVLNRVLWYRCPSLHRGFPVGEVNLALPK